MITTVTLNPCNDMTLRIDELVIGGMNRVRSQRFDIAGKGFNVARGIVRLGGQATATGFLYNDNGADTERTLKDDGVVVDCVWKPGRIRTNTKVFDANEATVTEFNSPGVSVSARDLDDVFDKIVGLARVSDYLVLSGSLPPGAPTDTYGRLVAKCRDLCKVILDAEGESLLKGIAAKPYMVKPNRFELESAVGVPLPTLAYIQEAAMSITRKGIPIVAVSLGADGALICGPDECFYAPPVEGIVVRGTVGAGDSMMAGFCIGLEKKMELPNIFRMGVAAATACVTLEGTGLVTRAGMEEMRSRVQIQKIEKP